jgi:pyruvate dehydrogenase E2 component (dihydrolipoamide acetyltransferase)
MPNLDLRKKRDLSPFRKIAIGTWQTAYDPSVYGALTLRMENALAYLDAFREATGKRLTLTHMMAKAAAAVLQEMPDANAILRYNRIYLRDRIAVFFQVALTDPKTGEIDLSGARVDQPETKTLEAIVDEIEAKVGSVRSGDDKKLAASRGMFRRVPYFFLNRMMKIVSFLSYTLNLDMRWAGVPRDPFGSVMITNIGSLGLSHAYVPLVPYSRVPLVLAMGAVEDQAVVDDGKIVPGKVMTINATFDHRVLDGSHAAKMARTLRAWMEHPLDHFDPIPSASGDES